MMFRRGIVVEGGLQESQAYPAFCLGIEGLNPRCTLEILEIGFSLEPLFQEGLQTKQPRREQESRGRDEEGVFAELRRKLYPHLLQPVNEPQP
ncbi:MAG TPA: hypothetical protein VMU28_03730 [Terriglobales bacterium]|nr:hypothetical protein [Terriglobales bacterium]